MDITIAQFKRHYVIVCVIIAFSLTGILIGYREFLACQVFPLASIASACNASFLFFFAIGVMLPQWLLKAVFLTEHLKSSGHSGLLATLPSGRADLQPVTLVLSGVSLLLAVVVVLAVFWRSSFSVLRSDIYRNFFLNDYYWLCDSVLVFLFTGIVWVLAGVLCAMLYRMVLSLTTQTGTYQTLEQRFYMLLLAGHIAGGIIWPFLLGQLNNTALVLLLALLPLTLSAFWLPAVFSHSAERSYIKHFELKTGVQERSYISTFTACLVVLLGGLLLGGYLPVLAHIESLAGFGLISDRFQDASMAALLFAGWYMAYRREISGGQYEAGAIIPLYRWSAACLGTVFVLSLINRQGWCDNPLAICIWYIFYGCGLIFLGDLLYIIKQLMPRAIASLSLSWVLWVVMSCLGGLLGNLFFGHLLLQAAGSLMTAIVMFFGSVIAGGILIIFTSSQEQWHRRVLVFCLLPIIFSTLIIFWISHNWILRKHDNIAGYCETLSGNWEIRQYGNYDCWFAPVSDVLCDSDPAWAMKWGLRLRDVVSDTTIKKILVAGSALAELSLLPGSLQKDIIADQHLFASPHLVEAYPIRKLGIKNIFWDFEQVLSDRWQSYDLIWLDGPEYFDRGLSGNLYFWHRLLRLIKNDGILIIGWDGNKEDLLRSELNQTLSLIAGAAGADVSVIPMAADENMALPECALLTVLKNRSLTRQ